MDLGEKISIERKKKGLSQELLAENCGISLRTIQRIENNKSKPRPYTLKVIADNLNIKIEELEQDSEPEFVTNDSSISKINLINSSALLGILFPSLNIIVPIILWKVNNKDSLVLQKGKKIISFQILWSLFSLLILFMTHYIHFKVTGKFITEGISFEFIVYLLLLLVNVVVIIKNSIRLKKGDTEIYSSFPVMF